MDREHLARLTNWGLWCRLGGFPKLGYPTWGEIMRRYWKQPGLGRITPNELDAEHLEEIISTLNVVSKNGFGLGELYAFILKLEFIEPGRPQSLKAEHVRRKFKRSCSERTYRYHYYNARRAVFIFAEPIK